MSEIVRIICPNLKCRAILSVPSNARGRTVRCRQCSARVRVPTNAKAVVATAPADGEVAPPTEQAGGGSASESAA